MGERTVNSRQIEVLEWIVAGCPDGVMTGTTHKTTSVALQNRRLAVVSKKGGEWRAVPTDAGRYFVEHGAYPAGHWATSMPPRHEQAPEGRSQPLRPRREPKVTGLRPVDQLLADLVEAGGEIVVQDPTDRSGYWEGLVSSATRYSKVPDGKLLKIARGKTWGERVIRMEDPPAWMTATLEPILVSEQLRSPHPVVKALRDDHDRLSLKRETRTRALRILDALAKASEARGYVVAKPHAESGYRHAKGYLRVTVNGQPNTVQLDELNDRKPHEPTVSEIREKERYSWKRVPDYDYFPSGRLRLSLLSESAVRQDTFSDTKTLRLEDRLSVVLQELELRAIVAADRAERQERERQARQHRWEQIRDEAVRQAREQHRAKTLGRQVDAWHEMQRLDAYLDAMAVRAADLGPGEQEAARNWLAWARAHREQYDPLNQALQLPSDPKFTSEVLTPFMQGLSPHGP